MPSLITLSENKPGARFQLGQRTLAIGRDPSRDIQVTDPKVSRKHALLRYDAGAYTISPAKAMNGVFVNGDEVAGERVLRDGDMVTLGDTDLWYTESDDMDATNALFRRKDASPANRNIHTIM